MCSLEKESLPLLNSSPVLILWLRAKLHQSSSKGPSGRLLGETPSVRFLWIGTGDAVGFLAAVIRGYVEHFPMLAPCNREEENIGY